MDTAPVMDRKEWDRAYRAGRITVPGFRYVKHSRAGRCLYFALLRLARGSRYPASPCVLACKPILTEFLE